MLLSQALMLEVGSMMPCSNVTWPRFQRVELNRLLEPQEGRVPRKILLLGDPGVGKSTLCQKNRS